MVLVSTNHYREVHNDIQGKIFDILDINEQNFKDSYDLHLGQALANDDMNNDNNDNWEMFGNTLNLCKEIQNKTE